MADKLGKTYTSVINKIDKLINDVATGKMSLQEIHIGYKLKAKVLGTNASGGMELAVARSKERGITSNTDINSAVRVKGSANVKYKKSVKETKMDQLKKDLDRVWNNGADAEIYLGVTFAKEGTVNTSNKTSKATEVTAEASVLGTGANAKMTTEGNKVTFDIGVQEGARAGTKFDLDVQNTSKFEGSAKITDQ